jgi:transcription initiation factor IIF auxiliary subunit
MFKYQKSISGAIDNKETSKSKAGICDSNIDQNLKEISLPSYQPHITNIVNKQAGKSKLTDEVFSSQSRLKSELIEKIVKNLTQGKNGAQLTDSPNEIAVMKNNAKKEAILMVAQLSSAEINTLAKATPEDIKLLLRSLAKKNKDGYSV